MNVRYGFWPQVHPRLQSNDRSTIDAVAGDLRTDGNFFQHNQGRLVNLIAQHNFFSQEGGWCRRTCKRGAGNLSRIHNPLVMFSNSLSQNGVDDLGRTVVGSHVALHVAGAGVDQAPAGIATAAKEQQPSVSEARYSQDVSQMCQSCCALKWVECEEGHGE